jgi:hypothetical protein
MSLTAHKKNGTPDPGLFNVKRGVMDHREVGKMMLYNHEPQQYVWDGPECNKLAGTDSTVFPPLMDPQDDIVSFSPDLCRWVDAKKLKYVTGNELLISTSSASIQSPDLCRWVMGFLR